MSVKNHIVVLTGAGISVESGLKAFRGSDGLWEGHRIEEVATPRAWQKDPEMVLKFYNERRKNCLEAQPNEAHKILAALEKDFKVTIVTQNIDDLHERAGSTDVIHLHGEIFKMRSQNNESLVYPIQGDINLGDKAGDGAQLRPDIVWFEEPVPRFEDASRVCTTAQVFVVIGTSLVVYPAAGLVNYAPPFCPKFMVDMNIPHHGLAHVTAIQKPATEGTAILRDKLYALFAD